MLFQLVKEEEYPQIAGNIIFLCSFPYLICGDSWTATRVGIIDPLLLKCYGVCLFVCLSDGKVSDGKGIKNFLIPSTAAGGRPRKSGKFATGRNG